MPVGLCRLMALAGLPATTRTRPTTCWLLLGGTPPAHQLYVLLGPVDETQNALPDVLAVAQVGCRHRHTTALPPTSAA